MEKDDTIKISKLTEAENRWGMDILAKVFADINNHGKRRTQEKYLGEEMYLHMACMEHCFPPRKK